MKATLLYIKLGECSKWADECLENNTYQKAKAWFDKIPQAILGNAFRGELVPTK